MRKIILTKKGLEEGEEDIAPKRRRDSEVSFEDSSSGYSSLSEQFAGGHLEFNFIYFISCDCKNIF